MPVPIRREVGCGPMIVDITAVSRDLAVRSIAQLEGELFGRGAWNANMVREELDAPARTYLLDVLGEAEQAVVRGYAGFWYDGEDAELMTIGVGKAYQRQGIAAALLQALVDEAKRQAPRACCSKCVWITTLRWPISAVRIRTHGIAQTLLPARRHRRIHHELGPET